MILRDLFENQNLQESGISSESLADTLTHRLVIRHPEVFQQHNLETIADAVMNTAEFYAGAEELGTSDIGHMLRQILRKLESRAQALDSDVAEGVNVDSQIKRTKDRILQLKDWNTAGTYDKRIKELQARLKELQSQKRGVAEGIFDRFKKPKDPKDGVEVANGIAYIGDKVEVRGYPGVKGVVAYTHHHDGKIAVMLYPRGYRTIAIAVDPARVDIIKQDVSEGSDIEYIVVIRDEQGKRSIRISALTPTDAKEKAEAQGYTVLKVKDPLENHYFRGQGVTEGRGQQQRAELERRLADLEQKYDPTASMSDDPRVAAQHDHIRREILDIKQQLDPKGYQDRLARDRARFAGLSPDEILQQIGIVGRPRIKTEDTPVPTAMIGSQETQPSPDQDPAQQAAMVAGAQAEKARQVQAQRQEIQQQIKQRQQEITGLQRAMSGPL